MILIDKPLTNVATPMILIVINRITEIATANPMILIVINRMTGEIAR